MTRIFPLAGLLRLRALAEDQAAAELALARREQAAAERRARETADRLAGSSMPVVGDRLAWHAAVAGRAALGALLTERRVEVGGAEALTVDRSVAWTDARQQVRALERLGERHDEAERAEEARAEQRVLDEIAGRRPPTTPEQDA
ncbi:flagellar FliJ family protein [Cellulomonas fengjieae]|uniref:Flagellar FliJ protein n=1 Tax=Cellulomonas fengjieae TaxID=2819978 RepID=A0ABS3SJ17_9CELL|nr:flagellar FliJ family protein [Cellulomonas fengjieae]MBO3084936.1 flagellar FliJ family protein [Cellulomonas fengjieae]QVI66462.1 flagellar FliJ family protein [Cellulomonas fengjieae]